MNQHPRYGLLWCLIVSVLLDLILNRIAGPFLVAIGGTNRISPFVAAFVSNLATLFVLAVLVDIGVSFFRKQAVPAVTLIALAAAAVLSPTFGFGNEVVLWVGLVTTLVLAFGIATTRKLPFRVQHALAWMGTCMGLAQAFRIFGSGLPPEWDYWWIVVLESIIVVTSISVFFGWATPISSISRRMAFVALLLIAEFVLVVAIGGHSVLASMLSATGITLFLPLSFYALAGLLVLLTLLKLLLTTDNTFRGIALGLFVVSGFSQNSVMTVLLPVVALTFLVYSYPKRERSLRAEWTSILKQRWPEDTGESVASGMTGAHS